MSGFRFRVGDFVMCNLGPNGWKLGRIIQLRYREDHWPDEKTAPYQVAVEENHDLIYVPVDDDRYCREAHAADLRIARRLDALAAFPPGQDWIEPDTVKANASLKAALRCEGSTPHAGEPTYRDGRCHGCGCCPRCWSYVELYSEHYRCAERNGLPVTRHLVDLGTVRVGDPVRHPANESLPSKRGFSQCPTLARLPPGINFTDDGALDGHLQFDPHRDASYEVEFVAVSTVDWEDATVGIVRLEIGFLVEGNEPPVGFDLDGFRHEQQKARDAVDRTLRDLSDTWDKWEQGTLRNSETCEQMRADLLRLRHQLEKHPKLDGGRWWAQLGGYYMNVHKLLDNTLFECELYLGYALSFPDAEVRHWAELNLDGCYQKRLLEAARFMWIDGIRQMMSGEWKAAAETLRRAADKKDGWGWAINFGDLWLSEAAARLAYGAELAAAAPARETDAASWIDEATRLLKRGVERTSEAGYFGAEGHPWASEIAAALTSYQTLTDKGSDTGDWHAAFRERTVYWCAQVLAGAPPFPPRPRPRLDDAGALVRRLPAPNG